MMLTIVAWRIPLRETIYRASIFEVLKRAPKANSRTTLDALLWSPDVSTFYESKRPPLAYGAKAHYQIAFKERRQYLHSMSRLCQIRLPLAVQDMCDP